MAPCPVPRSSDGRHCCHNLCRRAGSMSRASVPAEDRRPCNRRRCLRSAGRPGVDNRGRSGRGSWWFVHRATGRWPGGTPPFSARSTTVRLDRRGTDQHFSRRAASRRQGMEHFRPDALGRPTNKAVVERLLRTVDRRRIGPAAARLQNMHDAADHTPVIDPRNATGFVRQQRGKPPELFIAQPEIVRHLQTPTVWKFESDNSRSIKQFYGSGP